MPERNIKPHTPGGRKALRDQMDSERNVEVVKQSSPAASDLHRKHDPRVMDECSQNSDDEDDTYESEEEAISKLHSPNTASELLSALRARRTSESPSTARSVNSQQSKKNVGSENIWQDRKTTSPLDTAKPSNNLKKGKKSGSRWVVGIALAFVSISMVFIQHTIIPLGIESPKQDRLRDFAEDLQKIRQDFPKQDRRFWLDVQAGMEDLMKSSPKPWTFLLFSNETATIRCLAELLGKASSKALRAKNSLILRPEDIGKEYGDTIERLLPRIVENKAVVVHDLLNIDPDAIQAFHTMCDRENPLVKEAVYIMTIIAPGYTSSMRPEVFVENLLIKTFANGVHEDKLQPLITRLTDGPIIPVVSEKVPIACS